MIILGVDPGATGAAVLVEFKGEKKEILEINRFQGKPIQTDGFIKKTLDLEHAVDVIESLSGCIDHAGLEVFNPMRLNSNAIIASLFHTCGAIEALLTGFKIDFFRINTQDWQRKYNLIGKTKRDSILTAQKVYPDIGKILVKDADIADAALIAHYTFNYQLTK